MTWKTTHGHTRGRKTSPEFNSWIAMRQRCNDPKHEKYSSYGALGIQVCDRWQNSFENFLADMGPRPEGCTLDRRDRNGDYEPSNCRWATGKEQAANRRDFDNANTLKTHCPQGHAYDGSNVRVRGNTRKCRTCDRVRAQQNRDLKKAGLQ